MSDEIFFDGQRFISAAEASSAADLSRDYVARLCRDGKVKGRRIGKNWYVHEDSLKHFLVEQSHAKEVRRGQLSNERTKEYLLAHRVSSPTSSDLQQVFPENRAEESTENLIPIRRIVESDVREARATKSLASHAMHVQRALQTKALARGEGAVRFAPSMLATPSGVHEAVVRTLGHGSIHVPVHTLTPFAEFFQKFVAMLVAFSMTFGTYALVDPSYARFAIDSIQGSATSVSDVYVRVTGGGAGALLERSREKMFFAAENPNAALAQVSGAALAFIPDTVRNLARAVNSGIDDLVYAIAFPDSVTSSLAHAPTDGASVSVEIAPYARGTQNTSLSATLAQTPAAQSSAPIVQNLNSTPITVVERRVETERIVSAVGGITEDYLNQRLNTLESQITGRLLGASSGGGGGYTTINNNYQMIAQSNNIDKLGSVTIENSTFSGGTITGATITGGSVEAGSLTGVLGVGQGGTGTSTAPSYGQVLLGNASGAYDLVATSSLGITGGGGVSLSAANTWTALQFFSASASSTNFSNFGTAYFGGTATSTFDSGGNLSLAGTLSVTGSTTLANATTTNLFSTTASSTNLFSTSASFGSLSVLGALTQTGLGTFANGFVSQASSTVVGAFTTTGTNTFGGALNITGAITSTAGTANTFPYASTTAITGTNIFSTTASTTNLTISSLASGSILKATTGGSVIAATAGTDFESALTFSSPLSRIANTISIQNAAADGSTKGAASFTANDFDATTGNISLDYTNGQAASASTKGFLTSADWTTFNTKLASSSISNSAMVAALLSDETGTGSVVFSASPTFTGTAVFANTTNSGTLGVTGLSTLTGGFVSQASSTVVGAFTNTGAATFGSTLAASGLATFGNASSTLFSNTGVAYFGGSATTTIDSAGNLIVAGTISGAGLSACSGSSDKLLWNSTTKQFSCGTDQSGGGGGSDVNWTFFNNSALRPSTTTNQVLIGGTATTSSARLQVIGGLFTDYASSTVLSNFGTAYFGGTATTTINSAGNVAVAGTLGVTGNTTLANATTTNLFSTTASSTNLFSTSASFGSLSVLGALTQTGLGTFTNGFVSQASSTVVGAFTTTGTNTFGGALNIAGAITSTATTANTFPYASSTALTGTSIYSSTASTTNLTVSGIQSSLIVTSASGAASAYSGSTCTNQFVRSLNGAGIATCASIAAADLANADWGDITISGGVASLDADTVSDSEIDYATVTLADFTNDADYVKWASATSTLWKSAGLLSTASSTIGGGTQASGLTVSGGATTTGNLKVNGTSALDGAVTVGNGSVSLSTSDKGFLYNASLLSGYIPANTNLQSAINATRSLFFNIDSNNDDSDTRAIIFAKNSWNESGTELMRLSENGNLGIGTTTPWGKLSVQGSAGQSNPLLDIASSSNASYFSISNLGAIAATGAFTSTAGTANTFPYASSTALSVSGALYSGTASTTNLTVSGVPSSVLVTNASGVVAAASAQTCTNQFIRSLSAAYVATCASIASTDFANADWGDMTVSGGVVTLDADTVSDSEIDYTTVTLADFTNDANYAKTNVANSWTALQSFSTGASSTLLSVFGTTYFGGTATTTIDSVGNVAVAGTLGVTGNTTLANATTTSFAITNITNGLLSTNANGSVVATTSVGAGYITGTLGTINGTTLGRGDSITITAASSTLLANNNSWTGLNTFANATTTLLSGTTAWFTTFIGNLTGNVTGNASTATALQTGRTINGTTFDGTGNITITAASSTLLANNNTFSGANTFTSAITSTAGTANTFPYASSTALSVSGALYSGTASTTNLTVSGVPSSVLVTNASGVVAAASAQTCTNQFIRSLSAAYVATCASIASTDFANADWGDMTVSGGVVTLDADTVSDSEIDYTTVTLADFTNDANYAKTNVANSWTALQSLASGASSTQFSVFGKAYFGGTATSTFDSAGNLSVAGTLGVTGNTTLANATTTNLFSTTASSTNLFSTSASFGSLSVLGALTQTGLGTFTNGFVSQASSTVVGAFTTTGTLTLGSVINFTGGQATTSLLNISGQTYFAASTTNRSIYLGSGAGKTSLMSGAAGTDNFGVGLTALAANTTGDDNTAIGAYTLFSNTSGIANSAIGNSALYSNATGTYNNAFGLNSLFSNTGGDYNNALGYAALFWNSTGDNNNAIGNSALYNNRTGTDNNALGQSALTSNNTGTYNNALGYFALTSNTSGTDNNALGYRTLYNNISGSNNNAFGKHALYSNTTGTNNTALGYQAGYNVTTGFSNTFIGDNTQTTGGITTGGGNIGLGSNVFFPSTTTNSQLNIGNLIFGTLPATTTAWMLPISGTIGVGTTSPLSKFGIAANNGDTLTTLFQISSSTASATTSLFSISNTGAVSASGAITSTAGTANTFPYASTTALSVSGALYSGTASTTNLTVSGVPSSVLVTNASGVVAAASAQTCTNQFIRSLSAAYVATCASVAPADLSNADFGDFTVSSGVASLDADTVSDSEIDYTTVTLADFTNDADFVKWASATSTLWKSAGLLATASSTIGDGTQTGGLTISGGATTTGNLAVQGSATSTFSNGISSTYLNITGTGATSTFAGGINLSGGCLAVNGTCVGGGGSGASTGAANVFTALQTFSAGASTTQLSVFQKAYFGGTATSTFNSDGSLSMVASITSTASTASTFPYASSTALTVSGTGYFGTASTTNLTVSSLTSGRVPFITTAGAFTDSSAFAFDSSLARLTVTNASTTAFSVSGNAYFAGSGIWNSSGSVGVGTTSPYAKLAVQATAGQTNPLFDIASSSVGTSFFTITSSGSVGVGTSSPSARLEVVHTSSGATAEQLYLTNFASATSTASRMTFRAADVSGSATSTAAITSILQQNYTTGKGDLAFSTLQSGTLTEVFRATSLGNVGVGTTTPLRRFAVEQAASAAQFSVAYDTTRVTEIQTDSSGDAIINPSGDDIRVNDDNLWVCSGGSCPSGTPSGTGNLLVETALGVGTSTPVWPLTASHTTLPQLSLTDGSATSNAWTFRSVTNTLYIATSTASATSTVAAVTITPNGRFGVGTSTPTTLLSVGGLLSVGASSTGQLATMGTATSTFNGDIKITGKLDVGTIDPVYTIAGIKYATYGHSTVGIKEETVQTIHLEKADDGSYAYTIDFDHLQKGSDLWLFYQITDFGKNWSALVVSLTPSFEGTVYYKKNVAENTLTIKSNKKGEVSMRLVGNRFDFSKWPNLRTDQDGDTSGSHVIPVKSRQ